MATKNAKNSIEFPTHSRCQDCPLYEGAINPGLPTRKLSFRGEECDDRVWKDRAILFVGQAPGLNEDLAGRTWIGFAGGLLERFVTLAKIRELADIYVSNAVRCKPPQGAVPTDGQVAICRQHIEKDLELLSSNYKEVVLVACGAKAAKSIARQRSLGHGLRKQGQQGVWPDYSCFYTNNPAILHTKRSPSLAKSVEDHFRLIVRYLRGEFIPNDLSIVPMLGAPVPPRIHNNLVAFDVETYGILAGNSQTVFTPRKSFYVDGYPYREQVVTCAFAWRDIEGVLRTAVYCMKWEGHREIVRQWFKRMVDSGITALGQNTKFDLQYLRAADPSLRQWVNPSKLIVDDTMLMSFLEYEQRPERGLKEQALLFGIADYSSSGVTGKEGNATGYGDPELLEYNCLDAAVTYLLYEEMDRRIKSIYGDSSRKNSEFCKAMRNMTVWCVTDLERNGSTLWLPKLKEVHDEYEARKDAACHRAEHDHGIKLHGIGSDAPLRELFLRLAFGAGLIDDPRLEWSEKTGAISIGVGNSNLLLKYLGDTDGGRDILELFQEYKDCAKITNTYTRPLLTNKKRGVVHTKGNVGYVYPSWFPIPSYSNRGAAQDDRAMGQIQGRFSASGPARLTEPKTIRNCSCSRFDGGKLWEYDMSQDHLRMAALLSNDPVLYSAYTSDGASLHTMTAQDIFPEADPASAGWKESKEYKLGKTLNFLILFRGGADTYVQTARRDVGVEIDLEFADRAIRTWYDVHPVFHQWQDSLIREVMRKGYYETITGWSRTFGKGAEGVASSINEICNCAIQTPCAQCTQSAQFEIIKEFELREMNSLICLQIYDSVFVDVYPGEEKLVDEIVPRHLEHPPVLRELEKQLGRTIPFVCEKKEYESYG